MRKIVCVDVGQCSPDVVSAEISASSPFAKLDPLVDLVPTFGLGMVLLLATSIFVAVSFMGLTGS